MTYDINSNAEKNRRKRMSKVLKGVRTSVWVKILMVAIGGFLGRIFQRLTADQLNVRDSNKLLVPFGSRADTGLYVSDLVSIIVGVLLVLFGSRVHSVFRWIGFGWISATVGYEIYEATQPNP